MTTDTLSKKETLRSGPAAAAMIASGIATLTIGLMTTGTVLSAGLKDILNWWGPAGPLTGKTGVAVLTWLISWALMNAFWKDKDYDLGKAFVITLVLIGLGLLFTFPPIFEALE